MKNKDKQKQYIFKRGDTVWAVANTEYKLLHTVIMKKSRSTYKVKDYPYLLHKTAIFYTKNEAIDLLIKRLDALKDRYPSKQEQKEKKLLLRYLNALNDATVIENVNIITVGANNDETKIQSYAA